MSVNFSSHSKSSFDSHAGCINSTATVLIGTAFSVTRAVLIIPLSIFVLYLGLQRWRQQRPGATASHSDIFTYHLAALQFIWALGFAFSCCSPFEFPEIITVAHCLYSITMYGESSFHVLTCVDRYLAVVHPITYMLQKNGHGVRIRNISIGCTWVFCVVWSIVTSICLSISVTLTPLLFSLAVVSFCSLSVLCVLKRPGPQKGARKKGQVDQAKQRAFLTIMAITGVLWLWFLGVLVTHILRTLPLLSDDVSCMLAACIFWFGLPPSLLLPLLYLQRAGKLSFCFCTRRKR